MLSEALKLKVIHFIESSEKYSGKKIRFQEAISTNTLNFDRHFTTFNAAEFILDKVFWRISGGRIIFDGKESYYEISADRITDFQEIGDGIFEFLEMYSETVYRRSRLEIGLKIL